MMSVDRMPARPVDATQCRVNERRPFVRGPVIDEPVRAAMRDLGMTRSESFVSRLNDRWSPPSLSYPSRKASWAFGTGAAGALIVMGSIRRAVLACVDRSRRQIRPRSEKRSAR